MNQRASDLSALCRALVGQTARELCIACGTRTNGPITCGPCTRASLVVIAGAYLELAAFEITEVERWDGADEEWGLSETRLARTRYASGTPDQRTAALDRGVLSDLAARAAAA